MPAVNVLIKPASSACNMRCSYCFYRDVSDHREHAFEGMLSLADMEKVIIAAMECAEGVCSFAFQGGEPTLAGLEFFRRTVALEEKHRRVGVEVRNAIQTNGFCVDEEWARFFSENHFLVGLSLDGPAELHNRNRRDAEDKGTFNRVMRAARLFDKFHVEYNILCVVTGKNARSIQSIYRFYRKQGFKWLQFIPCLEPMDQERGAEAYHLSRDAYGEFLIRLFDLWFQDLKRGDYISIRHLDNWLGILLGEEPEACSMQGRCSVQFVVEGDGGVYPCDFYVLDEWRLGTVGRQSFAEMARGGTARCFIESSCQVPEACRQCPAYPLCRNGCRRDRLPGPQGAAGHNYYCAAYRRFFAERGAELYQAAQMILRMRSGFC